MALKAAAREIRLSFRQELGDSVDFDIISDDIGILTEDDHLALLAGNPQPVSLVSFFLTLSI